MTRANATDGSIVAWLMTFSIADIDQILTTMGLAAGLLVALTRIYLNFLEWKNKRKK